MRRIVGIDLGSRRVGVALSDPLRITAQPYRVILRDGGVVSELREIVEHEDVEFAVVGLPLTADGGDGPAALAARDEAARLEEELGIPVELWDERNTTVTAERSLIEQRMSRDDRRRVIDKVAAAVMLQSYLDSHKGPS